MAVIPLPSTLSLPGIAAQNANLQWFDNNPNAYQGPEDLDLQSPNQWSQVTIVSNASQQSYTFLVHITGDIGFNIDKPQGMASNSLSQKVQSKKFPKIKLKMFLPNMNALTNYQSMVQDIIGSQSNNIRLASVNAQSGITITTFRVVHQGLNMYGVHTLALTKATIPDPGISSAVPFVEWECSQHDPQGVEVAAQLPATVPVGPSSSEADAVSTDPSQNAADQSTP